MSRLMRVLRGRPSTTESTVLLWAKSLLNAFLFGGVFIVLLPGLGHRLFPQALPIPPALGGFGAGALLLFAVGLWLVCLDGFSRRGRGTPNPGDAPSRLVADGPFRVVRNPIIVAELLALWAVTLYLGSAGALGYAFVATFAAHLVVVRVEEPVLRERFGEAYADYCRHVPRWLPRLSRTRA